MPTLEPQNAAFPRPAFRLAGSLALGSLVALGLFWLMTMLVQ